MKIIITIKSTANMDRIEQLVNHLHDLQKYGALLVGLKGFADVIESVTGDKQ